MSQHWISIFATLTSFTIFTLVLRRDMRKHKEIDRDTREKLAELEELMEKDREEIIAAAKINCLLCGNHFFTLCSSPDFDPLYCCYCGERVTVLTPEEKARREAEDNEGEEWKDA